MRPFVPTVGKSTVGAGGACAAFYKMKKVIKTT